MIYKIKNITILLLIIAFIENVNCHDFESEKDETANCDPIHPIIPVLNEASGKLSHSDFNAHKGNGSKCVWIIETNNTINLDVFHLSIGTNDILSVNSNDANNMLLYQFRGYQTPGILLTGVKNITVTLILNNDNIDRMFSANYGSNNSTQFQDISGANSFVFPYYNTTDGIKTNYEITFSTPLFGKKLLMTFENLQLNGGNVKFEKVVNFSGTPFDDKSKPPFLLSDSNQINMKISNFTTNKASNNIKINYELVESVCSQSRKFENIDSNYTNNLLIPNTTLLTYLTSFKCFQYVEHTNPNAIFLFELNQFKFTNILESISVFDGDSRDSRKLALIEPQFVGDYWSQLYLYSTSNKILVIYESPQVINKTSEYFFGVRPKSQGGDIVLTKSNALKNITLSKVKSKFPVIFTVIVDDGNQAVLDFDSNNVLPGDPNQTFVTISEANTRGGSPLIKLQSGYYPPDIMASNTNQMKIEISPYSPLKNNYSFQVLQINKGCHSSVSDISNSYSLSGCKSICSWLIPNRKPSDGTFVLQFSHLSLPLKSDKLRLEKLDSQKSTVLSLNGPLQTTVFPDLNLDPNESYVLYTDRECLNTSIDGSKLLGVSFIFVNEDLRNHTLNISVDSSEIISISPQNYPNYYSVGSDHLWKIEGNAENILITLTDLDLAPNHVLELKNSNGFQSFNSSDILRRTSDYVMALPLFLNLSSHSIGTKEPFSGRGFAVNLTKTQCGSASVIKPKDSLSISTPKSLAGISKCIWTLNVEDDKEKKETLNLLQFNIKFGKDVDLKNNGLKIYDSNTIRDNQMLNISYFNETKFSSINSIIIEYSISDPKKDLSLTLDFTTSVCDEELCGNSKRCMLKEFFCNKINDCGDWSDEKNCNSSQPQPSPSPPPTPQVSSGGVNGWVVLFVICPLCIGLGVAANVFGPTLIGRFRRGRYREFQDFSEVS